MVSSSKIWVLMVPLASRVTSISMTEGNMCGVTSVGEGGSQNDAVSCPSSHRAARTQGSTSCSKAQMSTLCLGLPQSLWAIWSVLQIVRSYVTSPPDLSAVLVQRSRARRKGCRHEAPVVGMEMFA